MTQTGLIAQVAEVLQLSLIGEGAERSPTHAREESTSTRLEGHLALARCTDSRTLRLAWVIVRA